MNYTVRIQTRDDKSAPAKGAEIIELPNIYLHFAHHTFDIVWNKKTERQDVVHGITKFFGGMGEGSTFKKWQDAIHASLYDAYQVYEELKEGDTFTVTYRGKTAFFRCDGVHVVKIGA
jgi:hypothetical protein